MKSLKLSFLLTTMLTTAGLAGTFGFATDANAGHSYGGPGYEEGLARGRAERDRIIRNENYEAGRKEGKYDGYCDSSYANSRYPGYEDGCQKGLDERADDIRRRNYRRGREQGKYGGGYGYPHGEDHSQREYNNGNAEAAAIEAVLGALLNTIR